jgi:hypothetical protein
MKIRPVTAIASFQTIVEDLARAAAGEVVVVTSTNATVAAEQCDAATV